MSSDNVFKAPTPVQWSRTLITSEEERAIQLKMHCLEKLATHPRKNEPKIQFFYDRLCECQSLFLQSVNNRYTEEGREMVEKLIKEMRLLEEIVIRVILQGEDAGVVYWDLVAHRPALFPYPLTGPEPTPASQ